MGSPMQRMGHDKENVKELFKEIGIEDLDVEKVDRIGRPDLEKTRLIRYRCQDQKEKWRILSMSKNLRKSTKFRNVFINLDLTNSQRQINRELQKELRVRREAGEKVRIQRGRIVSEDNQSNQLFQ